MIHIRTMNESMTSNEITHEREEEENDQQNLQDDDICSIPDLVDSEVEPEENHELEDIGSRTCTKNYRAKRCILKPVCTRWASYIWMLNMNHFIATITAAERRFSSLRFRRSNTLHDTDYQNVD